MPRSKLTFWGPIRRRPAVEATLAMGLTIGLVTAIDQIGDGLVASMGAFSILYFVDMPANKRIFNTAAVAAALIAASILGALCGANELVLVGLLAIVAGVVSVLAQATAAGPPGALMFVVATGASAHLAAGTFPVKRVGYLVAFGGVVSVAIVLVGGWFQRNVPGATAQAQWNWSRVNAAHVLRLIIAAALGGVLCVALHTDRPYWAVAAAVAVLSSAEPRITMARGFYRFFGTCAGVGVFSLIEWPDPKVPDSPRAP